MAFAWRLAARFWDYDFLISGEAGCELLAFVMSHYIYTSINLILNNFTIVPCPYLPYSSSSSS